MEEETIRTNRDYWNKNADAWFGTTALPVYGVLCPTEEELGLFGDIQGRRMLEVCCGSGHSLLYHARRGAGELWGLDLSKRQLENARRLLEENGYSARLLCGAMEEDLGLPERYFDCVYSIYGIGWTTDLPGTFQRIASYLKPGGTFIFSWHHPLNYCAGWMPERGNGWEGEEIPLTRSYFDEEPFRMPVDGMEIVLRNRKLSTYVNALSEAGFCLERMVEETDPAVLEAEPEGFKEKKAHMLPISVIFKARRLQAAGERTDRCVNKLREERENGTIR